MLSKKALQELLEAIRKYPGGFVVLEENSPKFAILDYDVYQNLQTTPKNQVTETKKKMKILITGGAGYIGSHTARELSDAGHQITTLDNLSTGIREFAQGEFIKGDLADTDLLDSVFEEGKFDAVIHFAASIQVEESTRKPLEYYQNNVINGLNLLEAMVKHGVSDIVFSSSCTVYDEKSPVPMDENSPIKPSSPYGETKAVYENVLKWAAGAYNLRAVSLRYFNPAGAALDGALGLANPESSLLIPNVLDVAMGRKETLKVFGNDYPTQDGTGVRDYIHVLDLAAAHALALKYIREKMEPGSYDVFNVGTEKGYTVLEIINAVCDVTGRMVNFEMAPRRAGDRAEVIANASKIKQAMDFEPKYSDLKTIIETHWAFHKKRFTE